MDGKELLKHLMRESGENPNSLANKLQNRSLQSQIQRFVDGITKEPRVSTLQPVADFFQIPVEALVVPSVAQEVAIARNLLSDEELLMDVAEQLTLLTPLQEFLEKRDWDLIDLARGINKPLAYVERLLKGDERVSRELIDSYMHMLQPSVQSPLSTYQVTRTKVDSNLADLVMQLGAELEKVDPRARKPVCEAIKEVLATPDQAKYYSNMISSILNTKQSRAA